MKKDLKKFKEEIVAEIKRDFEKRREDRRFLERQWNLNANFLMGNQYCQVAPNGEVRDEDSDFYWQNRNVYNHVAPIVETRLAKLSRVRPAMSVRAVGGEERDLKTAKISSNVLNATCNRIDLGSIIAKVTLWAETCGSAFYKVVWNDKEGKVLGNVDGVSVTEGDVDVLAVSPYEIFPESLFRQDLAEQKSLIHARAVSVDDIEAVYGVRVKGEEIDVFSLDSSSKGGAILTNAQTNKTVGNCAILIEKYERPTIAHPNGRLTIVAGDELLFVGDLPYVNGANDKRDFPFVKQDCIAQAGMFFGASVIERVIPVQRAYNAVKNRKHEFLNRVSVGVLTVEDGSCDTDMLTEEGLQPGKVIVYRQGSQPPRMMQAQSVPLDFTYEEERLTNEFVTVSGVSEVSRNSLIPTNITSGVAIQLLIEQDETRLSITAENAKTAIKFVAKQIIRLFKQFATQTRMMKIVGDNKTAELFYFNSSDITSDDVVFDTENELSNTPAQKKNAVLELLQAGLLTESDGTLNSRTKAKLLEILGYGTLDNTQDLTNLHISRASEENLTVLEGIEVEDYDDHDVHILEHTRYLLSGEINSLKKKDETKKLLAEHIAKHKKTQLSILSEEQTIANALMGKGQENLKENE